MTDITVNNKYVLIYDGSTYKSGTLTTGEVKSPYTVEVFDTVQDIFDRGLELGFNCSTEDRVRMLEAGVLLPADVEAHLLSYIWGDEYMHYWKRMEDLEYEQPK